jgi:hypothetical protein
MKYIYNPVSGTLDETAKIGAKQESKTHTQPRRESKNTKEVPKVRQETMPERIERMAYIYDGIGKRPKHMDDKSVMSLEDMKPEGNNVLSKHDVVFASMSPKEAMEWTGGYDKEKIKFLREVKSKIRMQKTINAKNDESPKPFKKIKKPATPVDIDIEGISKSISDYTNTVEPVRPDLNKRIDEDLSKGIATILNIPKNI